MAQSSPSASLTTNGSAALAPGGGSVSLTARIVFSGTPSALGWTVTIPPGWSYAGGTDEPGVKPFVGQNGDTLDWAWTSIPTSPAQFSFNLNYPAGTSGGTISALATYRENSTLQRIDPGTLTFSAASVNTPPTIAQSPASQTVTAGQSATFAVAATGRPAPGYQWQRKPAGSSLWSNLADGGNFAGATAAILTVSTTTTAMSGDQFQCVVSNGVPPNAISSVAALTVTAVVIGPPNAATIVTQPASQTITAGDRVVFAVTTTGQAPFSYQWSKDGVALAGATDSVFVLANAQPGDAGDYTVVVSNSANRINSAVATLTVNYARLTSISVRSGAGTGDQTLIVGFSLAGSAAKQMLIRGVGPALTQYGVSGVLADPQLKLFNSAGVQIGQNDDWGGDAALSAVFTRTGAFALPATSKDAALLTPLAGGAYSAYVTAAAGTGVALLDAYDADTGTPVSRVVSLSARSMAGQGDNTLIVGFAISGTGNKTLLIRGVGPTLTQYGVSGVLADPQLKLFNQQGQELQENNDWGGGAALANAFTATYAFALPAASKDAALLVTLPPGVYTAQVSGVGNTTGIALIEVYEVP